MSQEVTNFAKTKSLEELAREQQIVPIAKLEDVLGQGAELWESDQDLEQFLADLDHRRHESAHP